ncbi:meckelin isoform X2 [Tachypleus tridentatus]|uniref:meckelin isoform X2 n=1 Tax=Tachypleus tridentatus TaxID=6853 RepID=UPI003FD34116
MCSVFTSLFILLCIIHSCFTSYIIPFQNKKSCQDDEYFDPGSLSCKKCGGDNDEVHFLLQGSDGLSCTCKPQHKLVIQQGTNVKCEPCPEGQVSSLDGWHCVTCKSFGNFTGTCSSCSNGIKEETFEGDKLGDQFCRPCPPQTWPDISKTRCVRCADDFLVAGGGTCTCPQKEYAEVGGMCIPTSELPPTTPSLFTVRYKHEETLTSSFFVDHIQAAIYNCKVKQNGTACQLLGNFCVVLHYYMDNYNSGTDKDACSVYLDMTTDDHGLVIQWPQNSPWLYYLENEAKSELYRTNVPNQFSLNPLLPSSRLNITTAAFHLNGTFLGFLPFQETVRQLCSETPTKLKSAFTFGTIYKHSCKRKLQEFWDSSELIIYDLYLVSEQNNKSQLYPVPVLVSSLMKNGDYVNKGKDISKWQLVRRIFLTDPVTAIEARKKSIKRKPTATVFRYAKDISLSITLKNDDKTGTVYPPLLSVDYGESSYDDYMRDAEITITFSVSYHLDQEGRWKDISIAVGVLSALSSVWSFMQTWGWMRRAGKQTIDVVVLGKFIVFVSGCLANVFFMVIFSASLNWLIFYKNQDVVHLMLPSEEEERTISVYLGVALGLKTLQILHLLVIQCSVDVFFVDRERPRYRLNPKQGQQTNASGHVQSSQAKEGDSSIPGKVEDGTKSSKTVSGSRLIGEKQTDGSVSIWRTYYLASHWIDLQTIRRIHMGFQLCAILILLKILGLENLALADTRKSLVVTEDRLNTPFSSTCRLAIGGAIYLGVAIIQVLCYKILYERFVSDKLHHFVDLCSVSNVSVCLFTGPKFGYYIHGRAVQGRADVNMKEMHDILKKEEEDLCGNRGLLPNTEQQTFMMALPSGVHEQFLRKLNPLTSYSQGTDRMQGGGRLSKVDVDKVSGIYQNTNKFLAGFIDHSYKDLDYVVKDRMFLENLFDVEFYEPTERGYFYNDNGHSFDATLFIGNEGALLMFDVLLFCLIDNSTQDYILSAILTFLINKVIMYVRHNSGRRNVVRKALIDERFLT